MFSSKKTQKDMGQKLVPHLKSIWRFSLSLSGQPDIADDLTQATVLRAIEKAHQYKDTGNLAGWCLTICRSIWLNELRSKSVRKTGGMDTAKAIDLIDKNSDTEMNIFTSEVYSKIMTLPEAQRNTVELVYVQGFTYSEAAGILDVPIGTIMSRLSTARKELADLNPHIQTPVKGQTK